MALRSWRLHGVRSAAMAEQLHAVASRLEALESETSRSALRIDVAETVLLEKGVADEEDLEEARRYFEQNAAPRYDRERDGSLH